MPDSKRKIDPKSPVLTRVGNGQTPKLPTASEALNSGRTDRSISKIIIQGAGLQAIKGQVFNPGAEEKDPKGYAGTSYLGTPVFTNLKFLKGAYTPLGKETPVQFGELEINTVLITVSQSKNIVETPMAGHDGTVKEYISMGDYVIDIKGALASESSEVFPEEDTLKLLTLLKAPKSLEIASRYLNDVFDIHNIVIKSFDLGQNEGFQNIQFFSISAVSDDPIELDINN